jgi:tetratricopeptide (TPR) repeat protein
MNTETFYNELDQYFTDGQTGRVEGFLLQSLSEARESGDLHAAVTVLSEMAGYYRSRSQFSEAISAAEEALSIARSLNYAQSASYGTVLLNAATAYSASGANEKAKEYYECALAIYRSELNDFDPRIAGLLNNISNIYQTDGEYETASRLLLQAADILEFNGQEQELAYVKSNLAHIYIAMERQDEAIDNLNGALDIYERLGSQNDPHYAASLSVLGGVRYRKGDYKEALRVFVSACGLVESVLGKNRDYALLCKNCELVCEKLGMLEEAARYRREAAEIMANIETQP